MSTITIVATGFILIASVICLLALVKCGNAKYLAHGDRCRAETMMRMIPDWAEAPIMLHILTIHNENCVAVVGTWAGEEENLSSLDITIKKFHFDPKDVEDYQFAVREAEELQDKLLEK